MRLLGAKQLWAPSVAARRSLVTNAAFVDASQQADQRTAIGLAYGKTYRNTMPMGKHGKTMENQCMFMYCSKLLDFIMIYHRIGEHYYAIIMINTDLRLAAT